MRFTKAQVTLVAILGVFLVLGSVLVTLSIEAIRYTHHVPPTLYGMEPQAAYAAMQRESPEGYLFLDVRGEVEFNKLHATGSKNQPIHTLFDLWRDLPRDKNTEIYLICSGGRLAGVAYGFLQLHGFRNIVHITGGIQNWVAQSQPTVTASLFPSEE